MLCASHEGVSPGAIHDRHRAPKHACPVIKRPLQKNTAASLGPGLHESVLPLFSSSSAPCVSVICTVSFRSVKEIDSNSPFPLLITVIARKNGRQ